MFTRTLNRLRLWDVGPALMTGLALLLPFEARQPLLNLRVVQITSVELLLYLVLLIWGAGWVAGRWRTWSACHTGVMFFALAVLLSALLAQSEPAAALKFALRSLGGCALFFAAADLSSTYPQVIRCAIALAAGAFVSAAAGCAEMLSTSFAGLLGLFKTQPSQIGGYLRASGTFQYANIAAMYWEAAMPLLLALALIHGARDKYQRWTWIFPAAMLLIVEAIMLSMSRAAIVLAVIIPISCLALVWPAVSIRRAMAVACAIATVLPLSGHLLLSDFFRLRLKAPDEASWYRAAFSGAFGARVVKPGQVFLVPVQIRNLGAMIWPSQGPIKVSLSYHWEDPERGGFVVWDGLRTALPANVLPREEVELSARIQAPALTGRYLLHLDLAQEGTTWFSLKGSPGPRIPVELQGPVPQEILPDNTPLFRPVVSKVPTRAELWGAALKMWREHPLVGVGPDNFRLLYGPYLGLAHSDRRIHSNNLYLETLVNLGILGLLGLAAVFASLVSVLWRLWRRPVRVEVRLLALGLGASIASFFLHGFVDYFLEFTPTYALFWLLTGMAIGLARSRTVS